MIDDADEASRDSRLVVATLAGDRVAFGRLVERYQRRVFALAYRSLGDVDDASDLTQQAFLRAFENLSRLKRRSSFAAWLFTTTANLARNEIRFRASKSFQDIDNTPLATPAKGEAQLERQSRREAMRAAIDRLPEKQRRCVLLRIDADLSFQAIGRAVGCSTVSARVNYHHALRALRKMLCEEPTVGRT